MQNVFYYEVTIVNLDYNGTTSYGGFLTADTYCAAMAQIEEYYGEDIVSIDTLYAYDNELLSMPVAISRKWKNDYDCDGDSSMLGGNTPNDNPVSK